MEASLVQIAAKLLKTPNARAGLVMYSITNFHVWLQIIGDLFALDGTYPNSFKLWRSIAESLKTENDIRVRLAHHSISQEREKHGDEISYRAYLKASGLDVRTKSAKSKPLSMVQIVEFTGRINEIHQKIISLSDAMKLPKASR